MKNKIVVSLAIVLLVLGLFQITLNITPAVFSGESETRREIWKIVNVTNPMAYNTIVDINVTVSSLKGVHIACSTNITRYFENLTYWQGQGYATYMDWLNGTSSLVYHWGEMDWSVSNGSLTSITYNEIQHWGEMYFDSGGGVNYTTFMGNTYMADWNLTSPYNDPDIIYQAYWQGNQIKMIDDLIVPNGTSMYIVFKIVITESGGYTFNLTTTPGVTIAPSSWTVGGAATLLVPYEYTKIQEAVNAASPNFTVIVYDGIYDEQVIVNKSLTIQGMGNTTIIKPSSAANLTTILGGHFWGGTKQIAGIIVANATTGSNVTLKNFKVDGENITAKPTGADYISGIFYRETGGLIDMVTVTNMTIGATGTAVRGYGIYLSAIASTVSVEVKGSTITNYDKNSIDAHGNKLTVNIHHNTVTGRGPLPSGDEVQNGILIMDGATGTVNANTISNMAYIPETWWSAGIMFLDSGGSAVNNIVTECQIGVIFQDGNGSARGNTVNGGTVGLLGFWSQYTKGGTWTASFVNNTVSGARDSPGYDNGAIGAQTWNASASLTVSIADNQLIGGSTSADGIYIGDIPANSPAGIIAVTIFNNTISNWQHGIRFISSVNVTSSRVNFNNITGNQLYGIVNNCSGILDARFNWWGNETGPYHPTLNPTGLGNNVSDNVLFEPWLIKPYPPLTSVSVVYVDPQFITLGTPALGTVFTVNVTVANVTMLYGFQFKLRWNNTLLNLTRVDAKIPTVWGSNYISQYNQTTEYYSLFASARSPAPPFNGTTTLASFTFRSVYDPIYPQNVSCSFALENVTIADPDAKPILRLVYSGNYSCCSVKPKLLFTSKEYTAMKVPTEFDAYINVTNIVNLYNFSFAFTYDTSLLEVTYPYVSVPSFDGSLIVYKGWGNGTVFVNVTRITPAANGSLVLAMVRFKVKTGFVWNTKTPMINSTLNFTIHEFNSGTIEHEAVNGTYIYKPVPGDLNMDGLVDIVDLVLAAQNFGTSPGGPPYHFADLNCDGVIDILDIILVARNFGRTS
jgi:hypothetical protein